MRCKKARTPGVYWRAEPTDMTILDDSDVGKRAEFDRGAAEELENDRERLRASSRRFPPPGQSSRSSLRNEIGMQAAKLGVGKMAETRSCHLAHQRQVPVAERVSPPQQRCKRLQRVAGGDLQVGSSVASPQVQPVAFGAAGPGQIAP